MRAQQLAVVRRAVATVTDPWVLLASAMGAGCAWAVGLPPVLDVATGVAMLMSAAGVSAGAALLAANRHRDEDPTDSLKLRSGTGQRQLVDALEEYLRDLRDLESTRLPDAVTNSAIEALVAAGGARRSARRVAAAVDALDSALERTDRVARSVGGEGAGVRASRDRMATRRRALLANLGQAVGEVAEVYTKLLELTATVETLDLSDGTGDIESVNSSLDTLRTAFHELERDARSASALTT